MPSPIQGKNALVRAFREDSFFGICCVESWDIEMITPWQYTSTPDSGVWETKAGTGRSEWRVRLRGVAILRDLVGGRYSAVDLLRETIRQQGLDIEIVMTDDEGYSAFFSGHVLPTPTLLSFGVGDLGSFDTVLEGSGPFSINDNQINPGGTVTEYLYEATGGEGGIITDSALTNIKILWVDRSDFWWQADPDTGHTADVSQRRAIHNRAAGSLDFGTTLGAGEKIAMLLQTL